MNLENKKKNVIDDKNFKTIVKITNSVKKMHLI